MPTLTILSTCPHTHITSLELTPESHAKVNHEKSKFAHVTSIDLTINHDPAPFVSFGKGPQHSTLDSAGAAWVAQQAKDALNQYDEKDELNRFSVDEELRYIWPSISEGFRASCAASTGTPSEYLADKLDPGTSIKDSKASFRTIEYGIEGGKSSLEIMRLSVSFEPPVDDYRKQESKDEISSTLGICTPSSHGTSFSDLMNTRGAPSQSYSKFQTPTTDEP